MRSRGRMGPAPLRCCWGRRGVPTPGGAHPQLGDQWVNGDGGLLGRVKDRKGMRPVFPCPLGPKGAC